MSRHNQNANVPPANAMLSSEAQSELKREESDNNARINADKNVPPEQRQQPSPDSDDFGIEEEVGSTEGNSQTNDDNATFTTRKFNAL